MYKKFFIFFLLPCALVTAHQGLLTPVIQSSKPQSFVQIPEGAGSNKQLSLYGINLQPSAESGRFGGSEGQVQVLFRSSYAGYNTGGYIQVSDVTLDREGDQDVVRVSFSPNPWLSAPGNLYVVVKVQGSASYPYSIPVLPTPKEPPTILNISPDSWVAQYGLEASGAAKNDYHLRLNAKHLDDPERMTLTIGWQNTPIDASEPLGGYLLAQLPSALWNYAGKYPVTIATPQGISNTYMITITEKAKKTNAPQKQPLENTPPPPQTTPSNQPRPNEQQTMPTNQPKTNEPRTNPSRFSPPLFTPPKGY